MVPSRDLNEDVLGLHPVHDLGGDVGGRDPLSLVVDDLDSLQEAAAPNVSNTFKPENISIERCSSGLPPPAYFSLRLSREVCKCFPTILAEL